MFSIRLFHGNIYLVKTNSWKYLLSGLVHGNIYLVKTSSRVYFLMNVPKSQDLRRCSVKTDSRKYCMWGCIVIMSFVERFFHNRSPLSSESSSSSSSSLIIIVLHFHHHRPPLLSLPSSPSRSTLVLTTIPRETHTTVHIIRSAEPFSSVNKKKGK